jgi:hypothetical protein
MKIGLHCTTGSRDGTWSSETICTLNHNPFSVGINHLDIIKVGSTYYGLFMFAPTGGISVTTHLASSTDATTWDVARIPLINPSVDGFDATLVYRGSLAWTGRHFDIFYSGMRRSGSGGTTTVWRIARTTARKFA